MVELTEELHLDELLVRFIKGVPTGAHVVYRSTITRDGKVVNTFNLNAQPLTLENFSNSEILSEVTQSALARINELQVTINEEQNKLAIAQHTERALTEHLENANKSIQLLGTDLLQMRQSVDHLMSEFGLCKSNSDYKDVIIAGLKEQIYQLTTGGTNATDTPSTGDGDGEPELDLTTPETESPKDA